MPAFDETAKRRIRFQTRRGLLELDILLGRFMDKEFQHLSDDELAVFVEILDLSRAMCITEGRLPPLHRRGIRKTQKAALREQTRIYFGFATPEWRLPSWTK